VPAASSSFFCDFLNNLCYRLGASNYTYDQAVVGGGARQRAAGYM
jgi:hypothetical protein